MPGTSYMVTVVVVLIVIQANGRAGGDCDRVIWRLLGKSGGTASF